MKREIVLAVEPATFGRETAERLGEAFTRLFGPAVPVVTPVYVLTPDAAPLPSSWFNEAAPRLKADALSALTRALHGTPYPFGAPEVLIAPQGSHHGAVEQLNAYLDPSTALIAIPTDRGALLRRLLLGSFSEAMLFDSKAPILTVDVGPHRAPLPAAGDSKRLVAGVDAFAPGHDAVVDKVVAFAAAYGFEVVFVHAMLAGLGSSASVGEPLLVNPRALVKSHLGEEQTRALSLLDAMVELAESRGVVSTSKLLLSPLSVPKAVLYAAEVEAATLIAVASQTTPLRSLVSRSVARDVIRSAGLPVWTLPSQAQRLGLRASPSTL
jgi:nucleotide-binding universal stress UspA family protein